VQQIWKISTFTSFLSSKISFFFMYKLAFTNYILLVKFTGMVSLVIVYFYSPWKDQTFQHHRNNVSWL
jgi:hypothetical protein